MIEKSKTGVEGLDEMLYGGFPKGYSVFLTGTAGSGKTTLSMQFLIEGSKEGEAGIYISFEEPPEQIVQDFSVFDSEINQLISTGKIKVVSLPLSSIENLKEEIESEIDASNVKRLVLDSVSYLRIFFPDSFSYRRAIIDLVNLFKKKSVTSILIGEIPYGLNSLSDTGVEEFASDGVIVLNTIQKQDTFIRSIKIVKMRGTKFLNKLCPYEFVENKGIIVYPNAEVFAEM